jgi:hypothetical protein
MHGRQEEGIVTAQAHRHASLPIDSLLSPTCTLFVFLQEENMHRRSNLYQFLEDPDGVDKARSWQYPMEPCSVLYSPNVVVFRFITVQAS